ncbi:MAG: hypothetical protein J6Y53_03005 [Alphaproteobacteria bacterium]|nr:hypothetical protein [Alphaproteobacteria bacterium]
MILFIAEFFLILYAPHQDENGRGFSICTQKMIEDVYNCNQKTWCVFKAVSKNYICYNKVIYKGFKNWLIGDSKTPWSEYYYSETAQEITPELEEFYKENPNIAEQMELLKQQNLELEKIYNENK